MQLKPPSRTDADANSNTYRHTGTLEMAPGLLLTGRCPHSPVQLAGGKFPAPIYKKANRKKRRISSKGMYSLGIEHPDRQSANGPGGAPVAAEEQSSAPSVDHHRSTARPAPHRRKHRGHVDSPVSMGPAIRPRSAYHVEMHLVRHTTHKIVLDSPKAWATAIVHSIRVCRAEAPVL